MTKNLKLQKECNQKNKQRKKNAIRRNNERRQQFMTGSLNILNNLYILACRAVREIFCDGSNGT